MIQPLMAAHASLFGETMQYRQMSSGAFGSWTDCMAELKAHFNGEEFDPQTQRLAKVERANLKLYDQPGTSAPTLRIGDEILDPNGRVWAVLERHHAERAAGVYRYLLRRKIPLRSQADRRDTVAEGAIVLESSEGSMATTFTATNIDVVTLFKGAIVHLDQTGVLLARNDQANKDAIGINTASCAVGGTATIVTEGALRLTDWTDVIGAALLTVGTKYYLDATPGKLTSTPPSSGWLQLVGTAITTTDLDLEIERAIQL